MKEVLYVLALMLFVSLASAYDVIPGMDGFSSEDGELYVTAVNFDPSPASPGGYVDVWLKVENRGQQEAASVFVTFPDAFPFTVVDEPTKSLGKLAGGQAGIAYFRLKVDPGAPSGPTPVRVELRRTALDTPEIAEARIQIKSIDAVLSIDAVTTVPDTVAPGSTVRIEVVVKNKADTTLRSIRGQLKLLTQVTTTTGISTLELPFTPIGTGTEKTADVLAPGASETLSFLLVANPDAENRPYKIPLTITYYDPTGANRTRDEIVGVIVGDVPELSVYVDSTELSTDVSTGNVIVRFVNRGVTDIKFLTARLNPTDEYIVVSAPEAYIGKIDSDDYETAEFTLSLTNKADKEIELPLVMEYRDGNNKKYGNGMTLTIPRYTPAQLGQSNGSFGVIFFILVILGVGGWWLYRRRKKR
ncbi:hypothetical protein HY492_00910 [Candidatus Woesearchaeota archaeon]|nr:hypothetical protein [Candidatus Woesearchaeota archaeon]